MKFTLSPRRMDAALEADVQNDVITLNGAVLDLGQIKDGDALPAEAIDTAWISGPITRSNGVLELSLVVPHGPNPPKETAFPGSVEVASGVVPMPAWAVVTEDEEDPTPAPQIVDRIGEIDWSQLDKAADRAARALDERRAAASLSRTEFAIALAGAAVISEQEAEDWAMGTGIPPIALAGLEAMPEADRFAARVEMRSAQTINRSAPMIGLLQSAAGLADAQVDQLFGLA